MNTINAAIGATTNHNLAFDEFTHLLSLLLLLFLVVLQMRYD